LRGLGDHFARFEDWRAFALRPWPEPDGTPATIDLTEGLEAAEARLDTLRPAAVNLYLGEHYLGHLPSKAGAEPWAGRHLRGEIFRHHGPAYLRAVAGAWAQSKPHADPERLDEALSRMSGWFGLSDSPWVFYEQADQWGRGPVTGRASTPGAGPALSFIIPAWNAAATVDQTLASLRAQTRSDWEAIVVDDGSTDKTLARLRAAASQDRRIRVLSTANRGAGTARNAALAWARADWITFLDADDWLAPTFMEKMLPLARTAGTEAVYCGFRKVTSDGAFQLDFFDAALEADVFGTLASRCPIAIHSVVVRRQTALDAGGFEQTYLPCDDWDFWLRMARRGARFKGLAETLAFYRLGQAASVTSDYRKLMSGGFRVLELAHGPDPRVADPAPGLADGAAPDKLPWLKMFYALWCAGADIGVGGTGDGFLENLPRPLPALGYEEALARTFAEALVTGARLPPAQMVGRVADWDAAIGRRLDELAEGQPRDGVALDLRRWLERWALRALPAGDEGRLSLMARVAIHPGLPRGIDLPDGVDSVLVDILGAGDPGEPVEVPAFGRLESGDQVSLAAPRIPPEQLDRYFAGARRSGMPSRTAESLAAAEAAAAEAMPDLEPIAAPEPARDIQAEPDKTADHWNEVFAEADPWGYTSAYEQGKYERTLELLPDGPIGRALELACAEGHFTRQLAPRVERLDAVDIASRAVERARSRCQELANVHFGTLDIRRDPIPGGQDLITCSEFLYYLDGREELAAVAARIAEAVRPGGAIVMANHFLLRDDKGRTGFDWDQAYGASVIHEVFAATPGLALDASIVTELYRVDRFRRLAPDAAVP
ncbi:MAG: glycosyltransferase, partial [Gemmatimonadales bacterium]